MLPSHDTPGRPAGVLPTGILLGYKLFATSDTGVFSHRKFPSPRNPRSGKSLHPHYTSYAPDTVSARNHPLLTNLPPTIILRKSAAYKPNRAAGQKPDSPIQHYVHCLT